MNEKSRSNFNLGSNKHLDKEFKENKRKLEEESVLADLEIARQKVKKLYRKEKRWEL